MIKVYICWKWIYDAVAHYHKKVPYKCIVKGATKEENKKIHCLFSLMGDDSFCVNNIFGYIPDKDKKYASFENFGWFLHAVFSEMHDWYLTWLDHGADAFWKLVFEKLRKKEKSETVYYLENHDKKKH